MKRTFIISVLVVGFCANSVVAEAMETISGKVVIKDDRPLARATVRIQGAEQFTLTDEHGFFRLSVRSFKLVQYITAAKVGYYTNRARLISGMQPLVIKL